MIPALALVSVMLNAGGEEFNDGYLHLYTDPPLATPEEGVTTQTKLATFRFASDAWSAAIADQAEAGSFAQVGTNFASGTPTWFLVTKADDLTPLLVGTVGTSGADLNLVSTDLAIGGTVTINSVLLRLPRS